LIPADDEGVSDPYLSITFNGAEIRSEILKTTINPVILINIKKIKI